MLQIGKKLGFDEGWKEGYMKGYEVGYSEGELDAKAEAGIVEISKEEFDELTKEDDITGDLDFHIDLKNQRLTLYDDRKESEDEA